jgi:hypothetical protein
MGGNVAGNLLSAGFTFPCGGSSISVTQLASDNPFPLSAYKLNN